jgi:DNA-binding NarL/FixJ family response regulator
MRVIIAEDGGLFRNLLIEELPRLGLDVIGSANSTQELIRLVDADPPDIVLLDIRMPREPTTDPEFGAGLEAAKQIREHHPNVALLALSNYAEVLWAEEMVALGPGVGFQLKDRVSHQAQLLEDMRVVAAGGVRIDDALIKALVDRKRANDPVATLTERERQVLRYIAQGLSNAAIAEKLYVQESTIEGQQTSIYQKLGLSGLPADEKTRINRRVKAVLAFLKSGKPSPKI